jgi:outer membrane protein assembly factor BamB
MEFLHNSFLAGIFDMIGKSVWVLLPVLMIASGCRGLRIADYPQDLDPVAQSFLTAQVNYNRNSVTDHELKPPLALVWEQEYLFLPENGLTAAGNIFFFGTGTGYLSAAFTRNGKLLGKNRLGEVCASPPTIYAGLLYQTFAAGKAGLVVYDLREGNILWRILKNVSKSSVIARDRKIFFMNTAGQLQCYNYLSGDLIWSRQVDTQAVNSPALYENCLIAAGLNGKISAVEYTSGVILWEATVNGAIMADPVIHEGCIYLVTYQGDLHIMDLKSGAMLRAMALNTPCYYAPAVDRGTIFLPLSNGNLQAVDNETFALNWVYQADGPWAASPLISLHYVYATNLDEKFYILDKKSGNLLQEIKLSGRARSSPIIIDNKLILTCENSTVIAYDQEH